MSIGSVVDGRWKVTGELTGATGSFNQGILFVQDQESHDNCIMKLLPTEAMIPGAATRETEILGALDHKNIVRCYWDYVPGPTEPYGAPWLVTEYCKDGNLESLMRKWNARKQLIPEYFVWQVFESLLSAIHYIHNGPDEPGVRTPWDSISHRDIIPSNISLKWEEVRRAVQPSPCTVKLGDFGCAVMDSEFQSSECNFEIDYLPCIDESYAPPEGAEPTEAADIYQIGLILSIMYCMADDPPNGLGDDMEGEDDSAADAAPEILNACDRGFLDQEIFPGFHGYSKLLRELIAKCLFHASDLRWTAKVLLSHVK